MNKKSYLQTAALILMVTTARSQQNGNGMRPRSSPDAAPSTSPTPKLRNNGSEPSNYRLFNNGQTGNGMRPRSSPVTAPTNSLFNNDQQGNGMRPTPFASQNGNGMRPRSSPGQNGNAMRPRSSPGQNGNA